MAVPTRIKFKDFIKAVPILAGEKGFDCDIDTTQRGSAIQFYLKRNGEIIKMWNVHEDKREKKIYTDDLKKACNALGVDKSDFERLIRNKFK